MHIVRWIRMDSAVGCHAFGTRHGSLVRPVKLVTRCFCTLLWFCDFSGFQHWVQTNTVEVIWCPAVRHDVSMFCEKLCVCVCFQESTTRFALTWMVTLHATEFDDATEHDTYHRSTLIHIDAQLHRHFWLSGEEAPALPSGKSMFQVYASAVPALDETLRLPAIAEKSHWCQTLYAWIHTLYITMYVVSFCIIWLYQVCFSWPLLAATFTQFAVEGGFGVFWVVFSPATECLDWKGKIKMWGSFWDVFDHPRALNLPWKSNVCEHLCDQIYIDKWFQWFLFCH